ncbi:AAA family ATPase [Sorangium sp. So ce1389]|uniref:AAA family ATPase n=1 Tax=Sorangium sp. So ce1389 TaxID=3133336 RepID=UPI003F62ADDF
MLGKIVIRGFKSVVAQTVDLGRVNVFVGANGAGKSVVLEAIGVLGAAAEGRVDDATLLRRGVRPGVPTLYKNAFAADEIPRLITLNARSKDQRPVVYDVSLDNPVRKGSAPWRFVNEKLALGEEDGSRKYVTRSSRGATLWGGRGKGHSFKPQDPTRSVADIPNPHGEPPPVVRELLSRLRAFAIYDPQTPVLRGISTETGPLDPVGTSGGRFAEALGELIERWKTIPQYASQRLWELLGWANGIRVGPPTADVISPSIPSPSRIIRFTDRFMRPKRNVLSAYDASEGALYVLFAFTLLFHPRTPSSFAIENVDHALHPLLARKLVSLVADCAAEADKQILLTTHNPLVLDALDLRNDEVRLFTVDRNKKGHTLVRRLEFTAALEKAMESKLTLSQMWTQGLIGGVPNIL